MKRLETLKMVVLVFVVAALLAGCSPTPTATPERRETPTKNAAKSTPSLPADSLVLTLAPGVSMEFVRVPEGSFIMGSAEGDSAAESSELPQHELELPEYCIGKYEVTVDQFAAFAETKGYETTAEKKGGGYVWTGEVWAYAQGADWEHPDGPESSVSGKRDHPVSHVSWDDAVAFCRWASAVTGATVRLPTEAQWEKAARGTRGGRYPWGNEAPNGRLLNYADRNFRASWADANEDDGYGVTSPVGEYSKQGDSPYGCADMAGNVWEWTSSLFEEYPYRAGDGREDPTDRGRRVLRGGSSADEAKLVRCAGRGKGSPAYNYYNLGLRVCVYPSR